MSCTCVIGGRDLCAFCASQQSIQRQLLALSARVVKLEEAFLAQANLLQELAAQHKSAAK